MFLCLIKKRLFLGTPKIFLFAVCLFITISLPVKSRAENIDRQIKELLKSELNTEINEEKISQTSQETKENCIRKLQFLEYGRKLLQDYNNHKKAVPIITQIIEIEATSSFGDKVLTGLLDVVAKKANIESIPSLLGKIEDTKKLVIAVGGIQAILDTYSVRIMEVYINARTAGKNDSEAWKNTNDTFRGQEDILDIQYSSGSIGTGAEANILKDEAKAEILHKRAAILFEYNKLIKEFDSDPQAKESFKQQILDEIGTGIEQQKLIKEQSTQTETPQNIFSKLLNWIGDGFKKVWRGVKNTIQKIGEAVKKPFTKNRNIEKTQPALISQPLKQQEDENEPQKIEEQKESISPPKEAEKKQDTAPKPAEAAKPIVYKNPFQGLYDFYPRDGEAQKCMKSKLGNKFTAFYNGDSIPTEEDLKPIEDCFGFGDMKIFFDLSPSSIQQCIKDAFGSDFEKALNDPNYKESSEVENKLQNCPAFQEWMTKSGALDLYIKSNKVATPTVSPTTPEKEALPPKISIAPINIDVPATAGSATFYITTNESVFRYGVVVSEDWSWLSAKFSVNKDTGKTEGPITATYAANNSSSPRIGKITITAEGATGIPAIGSPTILTITQAGAQDLTDTKLYTITATFVDEQGNNIKERLFFGMRNLATNDYGFGRSIDGGEFYYQLKNGEYRFSVFQSGENANYADYSATITINHKDLDLGIIPVRLIQQVLP